MDQSSNQDGQMGKDANPQIMEIFRGLQSSKLGEQCEAIAQFFNVVEKFPFPSVINSLFMKITDVFIASSNFLRLCILKTCTECATHLQKMTCLDDVIPKVITVMHSNDPVARGLTLRYFGILSGIMSENKTIHHLILVQLDSQYPVELDAAIWAGHKFAEISESFAASLCPKVISMLECLSTDTQWKLKLIPLCQHLHHTDTTLEEIHSCLAGLLVAYQSTDFVITVLRTLTVLATKSPIHADAQLDLLVCQLKIERRQEVQVSLVNNFKILARQMPHIWTSGQLQALCNFFCSSESRYLNQELALDVLSVLADSVAVTSMTFTTGEMASPLDCALSSVFSPHSGVCSRGVHLLCSLASRGTLEDAQDAAAMIVSLFNTGWHLNDIPEDDLKRVYRHMSKLIETHPSLSRIIDDMHLFSSLGKGPTKNVQYLCEFLNSLGSRISIPVAAPTRHLIHVLEQKATTGYVGMQVCGVLFQLWKGQLLPSDCISAVQAFLVRGETAWTAYRIGRLASRYGQHKLAAQIYSAISTKAVSEKFVFWLRGLSALSEAENVVSCRTEFTFTALVDALRETMEHLHRAKNAFACVSSRDMWFHSEYIRVRCKLFIALYDLAVLASHSFRSDSSASNLQVLTQNLRSIEEVIGDLKQLSERSIDADDASIAHLALQRNLVQIFTRSISSIINNQVKDMPSLVELSQDSTLMSRSVQSLVVYVKEKLPQIVNSDPEKQGENHKIQQTMEMLITLIDNATRIPLHLPRFFFQRLQSTDIRMELQPKLSASNEHYPVLLDVGHILQVMAVVQQKTPLSKLPRKITAVLIQVYVEPHTPGNQDSSSSTTPDSGPGSAVAKFVRVVPLLADYFTAQFVVSPPRPGLYRLRVEVEPRDHKGHTWTACPTTDQVTIRVESRGGQPAATVTSSTASLMTSSGQSGMTGSVLTSTTAQSMMKSVQGGGGPAIYMHQTVKL